MAILRKTWVLAAVVAATGCGLLRDPITVEDDERRLQVNGMLTAGDTVAAVLVTRTPRLPTTVGALPEPVRDAIVELLDGDAVIPLVADALGGEACRQSGFANDGLDYGPGCYAGPVPGGIRVGATYELRLRLPDGTTVHGEVTVPEAPVLLSPEGGTTYEYAAPDGTGGEPGDEIAARWEPLPDEAMYLHVDPVPEGCLAFISEVGEAFGTTHLDADRRDSATLRVQIVDCGADPIPARLDAHIVLTRFDAAYAAYVPLLRRDPDVMDESAASPGLDGALGAFAAAAQARIPVVLSQR